jgi:hypothetical protein
MFTLADARDVRAAEEYLTTCLDTTPSHSDGPDLDKVNPPAYPVELVTEVENMLAALKYDPGGLDGVADEQFECAITAFQKMNGLVRTGFINPQVIQALDSPVYPVHSKDHKGVHVEADLVRQVLVVYDDDEILRILPISSGANKPFPEPEGGYGSAKTPLGNFKFFAHIHGIHTGHLGDLYNPVYFEQGGYAVHGDTEVPPFNASHGCLRIPIRDSEWFEEKVPLGAPLLVSETELPSFRPE